MDVETEEGLARRYSMHFRVKAGKRVRGRESGHCAVCVHSRGVCGCEGLTVCRAFKKFCSCFSDLPLL
jgi:hypothetical protein